MSRPRRISAPLLALACASPALAQEAVPDDGHASVPTLALRYAGPPREAAERRPVDGLFQTAPSGVGLSRRALTLEVGSPANRNGIVGSWPLPGGLRAGVGFFSVTADGRKHADTMRPPPVDSVAPKRQRIAAVGLNLSF
jgi:hypothetical protein